MGAVEKLTTRVSTKGQVILPKVLRESRQWDAGTKLIVEDTADGVLLRAAPLFEPKAVGEVFGMLGYRGKAKTIDEMNAAITQEARRRARD